MSRRKVDHSGTRGEPKAVFSPAEQEAPATDDLIYRVAELAWKQGLAPNSILKVLNADKARGETYSIMPVKRALSKAIRQGILVLRTPLEFSCLDDLKNAGVRNARNYTVVRDDVFSQGTDPVCLAAAEQIVEIIQKLLLTGDEVVIANAGGRSISRTVQYLHAIAPVLSLAERDKLVFIALNSAGRRTEFDKSSNFLAVRLAEIFGGKHIATRVARSRRSETGGVLATRGSGPEGTPDDGVRPTIVERACQQREQFLESRGSVTSAASVLCFFHSLRRQIKIAQRYRGLPQQDGTGGSGVQ